MQRTYVDQNTFSAGVLAPELHARVNLDKYAAGLKTCRNWIIQQQGGARFRTGFEFVAEIRNSAIAPRLVPFQYNLEQSYVLTFEDLTMRVIKDGKEVVETNQVVTAIAATTPPVATVAAHGYVDDDDIYLLNVTNCPGGPYRINVLTANTFQLLDYRGNPIDATGWVVTGASVVNRIYTLASPFDADSAYQMRFTQSADVMTFAHTLYAPRDLTRSGHAAWSFSSVAFGATIATPTGQAAAPTGAGAITYSYKITAVSATTAEESIATAAATCVNASPLTDAVFNTVTWNVVSGAGFYNVYKKRGGVWGFIGAAESNSFVDNGVIADMTTVPPTAKTVFNAVNKYPGVVAYHQQRRFFAAPTENIQNIKASRSGNFKNFNTSTPSQNDDSLDFTLVAQQVHAIKHLVSLDELIALTAGGEWVIRGTDNGVLTPKSFYPKPQGQRGASDQRPLVVGGTVVYVDRTQTTVRELQYTYQSDKYDSADLTILAKHFFKNHTIVDWCYQQHPDSIIWAVREDGVLLGLTYNREQEVWAWHEHTTDGVFERVCCITEGLEDVLYAIVSRSVDGYGRRYIERLHTDERDTVADAFHVDSGLTYVRTPPVDELFGLDWLEGKTLAILADGNVHPARTVVAGRITLQAEYSVITFGLAIPEADIETLPIDANQLVGPHKSVPRAMLRVHEARGLQCGPSVDLLEDIPTPIEAYDTEGALTTGDVEVYTASGWGHHGQVVIRQPHPLPATLLAIVPMLAVGE